MPKILFQSLTRVGWECITRRTIFFLRTFQYLSILYSYKNCDRKRLLANVNRNFSTSFGDGQTDGVITNQEEVLTRVEVLTTAVDSIGIGSNSHSSQSMDQLYARNQILERKNNELRTENSNLRRQLEFYQANKTGKETSLKRERMV